jgi:FkbH-like protein
VHQSKDIIEYLLRLNGVNADIELGNYDNIVQESQKQKKDATIIFWQVENLVDGLQYKIDLLSQSEIDAVEQRTKSEIDLVINNLKDCPLILINKFSSLIFSYSIISNSKLDCLVNRLNIYLESFIQKNIRLINLDKIISNIGISHSFDLRYYYSSKAPYTIEFFKLYAQYINPFFMSANGKAKKALIFDCDNTLWKGVLGEDGIDGIDISATSKYGIIFREIQSIALSLSKQGVIIGLCSKNNLNEVNEVLNNHPDMILKDRHIAIKEVNWSDKATNLKRISKKINIGLDSIVFIDDSPFEVNLVKEYAKDVMVLQVPDRLYKYPEMFRNNLGLFYSLSLSKEDNNKTKMYVEQKQREVIKSKFSTVDKYLASLNLKVDIFENEKMLIPRIAQITQKTNQFNLTTKRYTEVEIKNMILSPDIDVYAFSIKDKFGDSGVTGLCIITSLDKSTVVIDSFLMSCRVIGRNIEYIFMDYIIESLKVKNIRNIKSEYRKTMKNTQVKYFFESCSFNIISSEGRTKFYDLPMDKYRRSGIKYIRIAKQ